MDTGGNYSSNDSPSPGCQGPANVTIPTALNAPYASLEIICAVLSIFGNAVFIFLFIKKRSLRTVKNCYVISLASADLLVGLIGIPSALVVSVGLPRDFHACLLMTSVLMLLCTASILSLVAVTIDRFWSIMHPLTYPATMTHNRARAAIFVCWCLSTVIGLLPLFGWNRGLPEQPRCFFVEVTHPGYLLFIFFGTIVAPSVFMGALYLAIFCEVRRQSKKLALVIAVSERQQRYSQAEVLPSSQGQPPDSVSRRGSTPDLSLNDRQLRRQLKTSAKTVKSIFIVVVVFLVSWFPLYILNTVVYFRPSICVPPAAYSSTIILSHLNSVWNPILYGWKMKDFRLAIKKLIYGPGARLDSSATA